jgi:hypothetical protein
MLSKEEERVDDMRVSLKSGQWVAYERASMRRRARLQ